VQSTYNARIVGYLEVMVDMERQYAECPCKFFDKFGLSCSHVKALLLALGKQMSWALSRYSMNTYKQSYSATIPSMTLVGKLSADETFVPPNFRRPAGRPSKKRKDQSWLLKTNKQRECQACGQYGHYAIKCDVPSTEYRYRKHLAKAVEYCQKMELAMIPDL
jgi:hypothetical protein